MSIIISVIDKNHLYSNGLQLVLNQLIIQPDFYKMIDIDLLLACGAAFKKLSAGNIIFNEGSNCSFYYQLVTGSVRLTNIDEEGKEYIQTFIQPGECFGELSLFDEGPYSATAIADEETVVIRLHRSIFQKLITEDQQLHFAFSKLLAQSMRFKFILLKALSGHDPEIKITTLLNYFKKENKNFCSDCNQLKLTRRQIADMTGLRVETVIRSMRNMHDKGQLLINKGKVYC